MCWASPFWCLFLVRQVWTTGWGKHETANPNHQKLNTRSGFDENKLPTMGSNTRLQHFMRKVEEMVMKLWSLIGQCLVRDTSLRDFGVISSRGNIGTLHFRPRSTQPNLRIAEPNQISVCLEILLFIWMCWASLFYRLFVGFTPKS